MAGELERQLTDPAYRELGFEERLGLLVTAEWNRRESNRMNRFIRAAHFYAFDGGILMDLIAALRFDKDLQEWYDSMTPEEREDTFGSHNEPLKDDLLI